MSCLENGTFTNGTKCVPEVVRESLNSDELWREVGKMLIFFLYIYLGIFLWSFLWNRCISKRLGRWRVRNLKEIVDKRQFESKPDKKKKSSRFKKKKKPKKLEKLGWKSQANGFTATKSINISNDKQNDLPEDFLKLADESDVGCCERCNCQRKCSEFGESLKRLAFWWSSIEFVFSLVICAFFVHRTYTKKYEDIPRLVEWVLNGFFCFHFVLRMVTTRSIKSFATSFTTICDLLALTSSFYSLWYDQWLSASFLRAILVQASYTAAKKRTMPILQLFMSKFTIQLVDLIWKILILVYVCSCVIFVFEHLGELPIWQGFDHLEWNFVNACYFILITISTVGYGDFSASTILGRIFVLVFIFVGIVIFSEQSSKLIALYQLSGKFQDPFINPEGAPFVVLAGNPSISIIMDFLEELYHPDRAQISPFILLRKVVVLSKNADLLASLQEEISEIPTFKYRVKLLNGGLLDADALERTQLPSAEAVFLFNAPVELEDRLQEDIRTIYQAMTIKKHVASKPIYMLMHTNRSKVRLEVGVPSPMKNTIYIDKFKMRLLGLSCISPGYSTLLYNLVKSSNDSQGLTKQGEYMRKFQEKKKLLLEKVSKKQDVEEGKEKEYYNWFEEYQKGASYEIYTIKIHGRYDGATYGAITQQMFTKYNILFLGVVDHGRVSIKPSKDRIIFKDQLCIICAQSDEDAELVGHLTLTNHLKEEDIQEHHLVKDGSKSSVDPKLIRVESTDQPIDVVNKKERDIEAEMNAMNDSDESEVDGGTINPKDHNSIELDEKEQKSDSEQFAESEAEVKVEEEVLSAQSDLEDKPIIEEKPSIVIETPEQKAADAADDQKLQQLKREEEERKMKEGNKGIDILDTQPKIDSPLQPKSNLKSPRRVDASGVELSDYELEEEKDSFNHSVVLEKPPSYVCRGHIIVVCESTNQIHHFVRTIRKRRKYKTIVIVSSEPFNTYDFDMLNERELHRVYFYHGQPISMSQPYLHRLGFHEAEKIVLMSSEAGLSKEGDDFLSDSHVIFTTLHLKTFVGKYDSVRRDEGLKEFRKEMEKEMRKQKKRRKLTVRGYKSVRHNNKLMDYEEEHEINEQQMKAFEQAGYYNQSFRKRNPDAAKIKIPGFMIGEINEEKSCKFLTNIHHNHASKSLDAINTHALHIEQTSVFASGSVFSASMAHLQLTQTFFNHTFSQIFEELANASETGCSVYLVSMCEELEKFIGHSFKRLFAFFVEKGALPIGLYRHHDHKVCEPGCVYKKLSPLVFCDHPYVYTCPDKDIVLCPNDRIFVLLMNSMNC